MENMQHNPNELCGITPFNLKMRLKAKIHYMINHILQIIGSILKNLTIFEHYD